MGIHDTSTSFFLFLKKKRTTNSPITQSQESPFSYIHTYIKLSNGARIHSQKKLKPKKPIHQFVQALSNPLYVHYLATQKLFEDDAFIRYLDYLQYFREPKYMRFLQYPGPTLRMLDLLQQDQFRKDAISPALIDDLVRTGFEASTAGLVGGGGR
ncbi:hypothetical protein D0867_15384 [Hortaea werneckii]|uniref:Mediator of RNA polymerase II transcription subunit 31 n=1 Tax=Hortaea werneckii TaxID=91943 RepID=A0A3M6XGV0_HORWE|nr:hypothetical protein D0867_15384 [Hortaea werneckii]RMY24415.1 hypothetical protein D0866_11396 [Hortaea werneckii]